MSIEDGGPAFPRPASSQPNISIGTEGMVFKPAADGVTVRDYFAAASLPEFIAEYGPVRAAAEAYNYADAMIAARRVGA